MKRKLRRKEKEKMREISYSMHLKTCVVLFIRHLKTCVVLFIRHLKTCVVLFIRHLKTYVKSNTQRLREQKLSRIIRNYQELSGTIRKLGQNLHQDFQPVGRDLIPWYFVHCCQENGNWNKIVKIQRGKESSWVWLELQQTYAMTWQARRFQYS